MAYGFPFPRHRSTGPGCASVDAYATRGEHCVRRWPWPSTGSGGCRAAQDVPAYLPGFKAERLVEVPVASEPAAARTVWRAVLHYSSLNERQPSPASALVSPDQHLMRIAFELHTVYGSGRGEID